MAIVLLMTALFIATGMWADRVNPWVKGWLTVMITLIILIIYANF